MNYTLTINFHGIPFAVSGTYRPYEYDTGAPEVFEISSVKASVILAGDVRLAELSAQDIEQPVWQYLAEKALEQIEAGL